MLGSASTTPPTDGALAEFVIVRADQCHLLPADMDDAIGAMMEPLSVALARGKTRRYGIGQTRARDWRGNHRPVGSHDGARVWRGSGCSQRYCRCPPEEGGRIGRGYALDPAARDLHDKVRELTGLGFDLVFEASGAPRPARGVRFGAPGGTIVQIGTVGTGDIPYPSTRSWCEKLTSADRCATVTRLMKQSA